MLETMVSVFSLICPVPCADAGASNCHGSFSVARSAINCAVVRAFAGFLPISTAMGTANMLRGMLAKLRYWLASRICRRYALGYLRDVDRKALEWTSPSSTRTSSCMAMPSTTPWFELASSTTLNGVAVRSGRHATVHRISQTLPCDDGKMDVMQMVVAAHDRDHAIIMLTDAIQRHNHRTRWRRQSPMFELMRSTVIEPPESCVLTPTCERFTNIHNGNYCGADASLYCTAAN